MKKIENKEKKTREPGKLRFNVIDVLIVVLVLACIAGIILRFSVLDGMWNTQKLDEYYITFTASNLSYDQLQSIVQAADPDNDGVNWVYFADSNTKLGHLTSTLNQNEEKLLFEVDGTPIYVDYPDTEPDENKKWTVTGTVLCLGTYSEIKGFLLNGNQYIGANSEFDVHIRDCDFTITVDNIEVQLQNE